MQGIILRAVAFQHNGLGLHLGGGGILVAGHNNTLYGDGRAYMQGADFVKILNGAVIDHLRILEARAIVKIDKAHVLLLAVVADPALQANLLTLKFRKALLQRAGGDNLHEKCPSHQRSAPWPKAQMGGAKCSIIYDTTNPARLQLSVANLVDSAARNMVYCP